VSRLAFSLVASVVLTIVLNVALRLFPGAARRLHESAARMAERSGYDPNVEPRRTNTRVMFPWKAMLIGSLLLTVLVNAVLLARR
jgi:hypothetical protein